MNVTDLSVTELKALAYDQLAQIERNQHNLRMINDEIVKRDTQAREANGVVKTEEVQPSV